MTAGMIALGLTFVVPFIGYLISGSRFTHRIETRSVEHASERLAQLAAEKVEPVKIHKLASQGEPVERTRRAA
jgi:hypothetical protein